MPSIFESKLDLLKLGISIPNSDHRVEDSQSNLVAAESILQEESLVLEQSSKRQPIVFAGNNDGANSDERQRKHGWSAIGEVELQCFEEDKSCSSKDEPPIIMKVKPVAKSSAKAKGVAAQFFSQGDGQFITPPSASRDEERLKNNDLQVEDMLDELSNGLKSKGASDKPFSLPRLPMASRSKVNEQLSVLQLIDHMIKEEELDEL